MTTNPAPSDAYSIRRATPDDIAGIVEVGRRVWVETFSHTTTPDHMAAYLDSAYRPDLISKALADPKLRYLTACLADTPGQVAGYAVLATDSSEPSVADWPNSIELQRIYIDTPHQGAGLARRLVEAVYELARAEGYKSIWLGVLPENTRAVKFYGKCGFRKVGTHEFWVGGQRDIDDILARTL
jgi:ribosomal protein S18 acetylase RimI-like enzyme